MASGSIAVMEIPWIQAGVPKGLLGLFSGSAHGMAPCRDECDINSSSFCLSGPSPLWAVPILKGMLSAKINKPGMMLGPQSCG